VLAYILRRLVLGALVLFLVTVIAFLLIQLVPGDIVTYMLGTNATNDQIQYLRDETWLDRPLIAQYGHWFTEIIRGNFGFSVGYYRPVAELLNTRIPITLHLVLVSLIIGTILGIIAGIICAIRRGGIIDSIVTLVANIGMAVPIYWLGILCIHFFALRLGWVPIQGYTSPFTDFWMSIKQTTLPILCMAIPQIAFIARQTRSSMLEVISQDYIRTAWSKGLKESYVVMRHVMKNCLIPVITFFSISLGTTIGGSVLIETVFNIPGMGRLITKAALDKDMYIVQACTLLIASMVVIVNLLADISYGWLDPRIRYK
jgi:peptide/nickel transport system permease protein